MLLEGAVSLSSYACSSRDDHWPCNGFTASTVPATGLRAVGFRSAYSHLVFLLVIPALRSAARQSIGKLYRPPTFDAGSPRWATFARFEPRRLATSIPQRLSFENRVMRASRTLAAS